MERVEHPEWILSAQEHLDDGKFNWKSNVKFPGYIAAKKWYPFGFCNALTHDRDRPRQDHCSRLKRIGELAAHSSRLYYNNMVLELVDSHATR